MLTQAFAFLLETFLGLFALALLLRFYLQLLRAPVRNPLSTFLAALTDWIVRSASRESFPVLAWLSASVINLFIPSGGGQWKVQGPLMMASAEGLGVDPGKTVMCVAYGDEYTNMLQPFWALPLLAITRVRARDIVGYTTIIMVVVGMWMTIGMLIF